MIIGSRWKLFLLLWLGNCLAMSTHAQETDFTWKFIPPSSIHNSRVDGITNSPVTGTVSGVCFSEQQSDHTQWTKLGFGMPSIEVPPLILMTGRIYLL